jgi:hypothetical protein
MKTLYTPPQQLGFFDLGLSFLILAIAGGSVYFIEHDQAEKLAQQREQTAISVNRQSVNAIAVMVDGELYVSPGELQ